MAMALKLLEIFLFFWHTDRYRQDLDNEIAICVYIDRGKVKAKQCENMKMAIHLEPCGIF